MVTAPRGARPWVMAIAALLAACKLDEVTVPVGEPVVVVHAVMRPDRDDQFVVVERSFSGEIDPGEFEVGDIPTEGSPRTPIEGATVEVRNLDLPADPCGWPVVFTNRPPPGPGRFTLPGVYWAPLACPTMRPGDRVALSVTTPEGDAVSGVTRIPGLGGALLSVAGTATPFGTDDTTTFNRDRDTLRLAVEAVTGRLVQLEVRRLTRVERVTRSTILADTTAFTVPGTVLDVFTQRGNEDVFRGGRHYTLVVALTDTNYYDFTRSSNDRFTGRGFINRLEGGIGVFGSLATLSTTVTVIGDADDPREGAYRLLGQLEGIDVDVDLDVYLARSIPDTELSAFVSGQWIRRCECGPAGASAWVARPVSRESVDGRFSGDMFEAIVNDPGELTFRYVLRGLRAVGSSFVVAVTDSAGLNSRVVGTLAVTQR